MGALRSAWRAPRLSLRRRLSFQLVQLPLDPLEVPFERAAAALKLFPLQERFDLRRAQVTDRRESTAFEACDERVEGCRQLRVAFLAFDTLGGPDDGAVRAIVEPLPDKLPRLSPLIESLDSALVHRDEEAFIGVDPPGLFPASLVDVSSARQPVTGRVELD